MLSICLFFVACNNSKQQHTELQAEVIAVHDTVMNQMSKLMDNKLKINDMLMHLDSLKQRNPDLDTIQLRGSFTIVRDELVAADDGMMNWMQNFKPDFAQGSQDSAMIYLNGQKDKIYEVKRSFDEAILKSDSIITKFK